MPIEMFKIYTLFAAVTVGGVAPLSEQGLKASSPPAPLQEPRSSRRESAHYSSGKDKSRLTSAASVQGIKARISSDNSFHVGAAVAESEADDNMIIAGGITAGTAAGQEGKLRAVAVV